MSDANPTSTTHKWILSDDDLVDWVKNNVSDVPLPVKIDSANLLLSVGETLKPGTEKSSGNSPEYESGNNGVIEPGDFMLVVTKEKIRMPLDCIGLVFGTNTRMCEGLLLINPGVITSGHNNHIQFLVLNIGKTTRQLKPVENKIARLLVIKTLGKNSKSLFTSSLDSDSDKFGQVIKQFNHNIRTETKNLVRSGAEKAVNDYEEKIKKKERHLIWELFIAGLAVALLLALVTTLSPIIAKRLSGDRVAKLETRTTILERSIPQNTQAKKTHERLNQLEKKIDRLTDSTNPSSKSEDD